jgi:hypothetical protein
VNRNWRGGVPDVERQSAAEMADMVQFRKDTRLASRDTRRWCLDRCLNTGHCDAVEDILDMSTKEVMAFCTECASIDECELDDQARSTAVEDE